VTTYYYSACGSRLSSTIPLPELRECPPGPVRWAFRVVDELPEAEDAELLGEEHIYGEVHARLYRHAAGHRITIDDTGCYDLLPSGDICWLPNPEPWWDFGRNHLIGRVLATSLQLSGVTTLHASAVETASGVVAFLAPKHFGKSTLALTLFRAGCNFVTDDSLPVVTDGEVLALPGIHSLRVRLEDGAPSLEGTPGRDGKLSLPPFPVDQVLPEPAPLVAVYLLKPQRADASLPAVSRLRVPPIIASMRLVAYCKIAGMLGSGFAADLLTATTSIADRVPVYELRLVRDLERLPDVAEQLLGWHGGQVRAPAMAE